MAVKPTGEVAKEANAYNKEAAQAAPQKAQQTKTVNKQVSQVKAEQLKQAPSGGSSQQRQVTCPTCGPQAKKKDVIGGKEYFNIPFTKKQIPNPLILLAPKTLGFDDSRRDGEKCKTCDGKKKIPDVSDDSAKYEQVQQKAQQNIQKTLDLEAKLGTGGSRTTIIQGSELLYVGLGFNKSDSYELIQKGQPNAGPVAGGSSGAFPEGYNSTAVVGKQTSAGWPSNVGNYTIKCANKFQMLAGAGGITMATKGPLTISAGITTISGPMVTIGSSSGPLTLEGDVVTITGKTITMSPTDKQLVVKGTISTTANMIVGGHMHTESVSFAKASCVGKSQTSTMDASNPDVIETMGAVWGGVATKGIASGVQELQLWATNIAADAKTAAIRLLSPDEMQNLSDRMASLATQTQPYEIAPTGFILPGTLITLLGTCPCNYPSPGSIAGPGLITGVVQAPIPLNNFPHKHSLQAMQHTHDTRVPDIDCSADSPQALRTKFMNGAVEGNAPYVPSDKKQYQLNFARNFSAFMTQTIVPKIQDIVKAFSFLT